MAELLCISTSERVLRTLFAGQNNFFTQTMEKLILMQKQMILLSERRTEHPFAGQNTQHRTINFYKSIIQRNDLNTKSFNNQAMMHHLNTGLIHNVDPHCITASESPGDFKLRELLF